MSGLRLEVHFLSDWHIGEGAGARGYLDAVVRRHPADGLPYVPAKTLTGLLREAAEIVARGLDRPVPQGWQALAVELFGQDPRDSEKPLQRARLRLGPARFTPAVRQALKEEPALQEALVHVRPGVKLDPDTGTAAQDMLRMEEVVMAGARLEAAAELDLPQGPRRQSALALLAAAAQLVERLGGKRRRGHGRCRLRWQSVPEDWRAQLMKPVPQDEADGRPALEPLATSGATAVGDGPAAMRHVFDIELVLEHPVLVPARSSGNVIETLDHIPGTHLLAALDGWLAEAFGEARRALIAAGRIRLANAYPVAGGERLLPAPLAFFQEKDGAAVRNLLHGEVDDGKQRKQWREGYVSEKAIFCPGQERPAPVRTATCALTHATIEPQSQRPTGEVGGVFTYAALAAGQVFGARLIVDAAFPEAMPLEAWLARAPARIRIGRSKKDDYGLVRMRVQQRAAPNPQGPEEETVARFTLWCAAPLIVRDEALRPVQDPDGLASALGGRLGVVLKVERAYVRPWRDDGWHDGWQCRRLTRFGLAPGSCALLAVSEGTLTRRALAELETQGFGERLAEGYGELRVEAPLLQLAEPPVQKGAPPASPDGPSEALDPGDPFAQALVERAWLRGIEKLASLAEKRWREKLGWESKRPPHSQLGTLRAALEVSDGQNGLARLQAVISALEDNAKRRDKWPKESLTQLKQWAEKPDSVWACFDQQMTQHWLAVPRGLDRQALQKKYCITALRTLLLTMIASHLRELPRADKKEEVRA